MIENPPSFVVRTELQKAAFDNGFRIDLGCGSGWLHFRSTTARGEIWLAAAEKSGPWLLSLGSAAITEEIALTPIMDVRGPGEATYAFAALEELHSALDRTYRLAVSLPDAPLKQFLSATAGAARITEAERLAVQRVGQDIFRQALLKYWNGQCPLTGITDAALLRASHIVAWADCETDALRLDVHNGLLLSALWDAAFDSGLISFDDSGKVLCSPAMSLAGANQLNIASHGELKLLDAHRANLARHRSKHGF